MPYVLEPMMPIVILGWRSEVHCDHESCLKLVGLLIKLSTAIVMLERVSISMMMNTSQESVRELVGS